MRIRSFNVIDAEPAPDQFPDFLRKRYWYGIYSARYGNIYTTQQLLQLASEAFSGLVPFGIAWQKDGRYFDSMRPGVEPEGFETEEELRIARDLHLDRVRHLFRTTDVLIFTLGLTEAWVHKDSSTVYPTAPDVIAGEFDPNLFEFRNFGFSEVLGAFLSFLELLSSERADGRPPRIILTVSPVPLTATASGMHVLAATNYSKSVLRAVAGELAQRHEHIDYFPSFEIITNPAARAVFYDSNLRTVRPDGVNCVMDCFFSQHGDSTKQAESTDHITKTTDKTKLARTEDVLCEEAILETLRSK